MKLRNHGGLMESIQNRYRVAPKPNNK
jgi:hypothetical protein